MVSYVEQPHRVKSSRLFGVLGIKAQYHKTRSVKLENDDDPVKAMQNRMLHTAIHGRSTTIYQPSPYSHSNNRTRRTTQFSNVKPPRGTLSDDKLPYLDWRLSQLHLQQAKSEAEAERLCQTYAHHFSHRSNHHIPTSIAYNDEKRSSSFNHTTMRKQKSTVSTSTESDFGSDQSSGQGIDTLDYVDTSDNSWHSSAAAKSGSEARSANYHQDLYANPVLHQTLLTNEALAAVPLLTNGARFNSSDSINEEDEDNENNDLFYEAEDETPAPPRSTSLQHRNTSASQDSSAIDNSSVTATRRLPKLFSRAPRRPAPASRSQSHGCLPTTATTTKGCEAIGRPAVNTDLYSEKTKRKWTLLSLHNLGGSEAMMRESDVLLM